MAGMIMEKVTIGNAELYCGDCLDIMPALNNTAINSIFTDPPYYKIKGGFDFALNSFDDFKNLIDSCGKEWKRILPKNGSLYVFGHAKIIAYQQTILDKYFNLENNLVWNVYDRRTKKGVANFRCYAPVTERCLFYSNEVERTGLEEIKLDITNFKSLREYFRLLHSALGVGKNKIINLVGGKADHAFRYNSTQWGLPTEETYIEIKNAFNCGNWEGWREYEALRQEYEALRRPFNNTLRLTDVIDHSQEGHITGQYNHETIKPVGLMEKLITTSTIKNDVVLDSFMGSGTTGIAAINHGRKFIGIEKDKQHFETACARIEAAQAQGRLAI